VVKVETPQEACIERKPLVAYIKVFESECFMHIPHKENTKLKPKSHQNILLGYNLELKGHWFYGPEARKLLLSQDLVFQEEPQKM